MIYYIIYVLIILIFFSLMYRLNKDATGKAKGFRSSITTIKLKEELNEIEIKKRDRTERILKWGYNYFSSITLFQISDKKEKELNYFSRRLHLVNNHVTLSGKDLYTIRCIAMSIYIIAICILCIFEIKLFILVLFYPLVGSLVDIWFDTEIKEKNSLIEKDFYQLYAEFYYNYRHQENRGIQPQAVAMRFYNRANAETKLLIDNLRADSRMGDEYALESMKENYRIIKIHRMCDQMKLIISGKSMGFQGLEGFKTELDAEKRLEMEKIKNLKKLKAERVTMIAICILMEVIGYWIVNIFI